MIDAKEQPTGFDIGVGQTASDGSYVDPDSTRAPRSLPTWVLVVAALLIGWMLGTLLGNRSVEPVEPGSAERARAVDAPTAETADLPARQPVAAAPLPAMRTAPSQTTPGQTDPAQTIPLPGATLVLAQLSGSDRLPSAVTAIDDAGASTVRVGQRIAGPTQAVGQVERRVQLVGESVVFVAGRQALIVGTATNEPPAFVADAATLLAGSGTGQVWALADGGRTVRLIDTATRTVRATYDLGSVGTPLASYRGGLVINPDVDRFGPFALWSPARGIERLWSLDEQTSFVDAAGNTIVVRTALGLATFDVVTGALSQTDRQLTDAELASAFLSPGGTRLAIVRKSLTGTTPTVEVLDVASGETVDDFETAAPWLVHWYSDDGIVHLSPSGGNEVTLRDAALGYDTALVRLGTEVTWMIVAER